MMPGLDIWWAEQVTRTPSPFQVWRLSFGSWVRVGSANSLPEAKELALETALSHSGVRVYGIDLLTVVLSVSRYTAGRVAKARVDAAALLAAPDGTPLKDLPVSRDRARTVRDWSERGWLSVRNVQWSIPQGRFQIVKVEKVWVVRQLALLESGPSLATRVLEYLANGEIRGLQECWEDLGVSEAELEAALVDLGRQDVGCGLVVLRGDT